MVFIECESIEKIARNNNEKNSSESQVYETSRCYNYRLAIKMFVSRIRGTGRISVSEIPTHVIACT
jgi:hypothetical protein